MRVQPEVEGTLMVRLIQICCFTSLLFSSGVWAQTVSAPPIFERSYVEIKVMDGGDLLWSYQNPSYTYVIDIMSFWTGSVDETVEFLNECQRLLDMPRTHPKSNIEHQHRHLRLTRYGWAQKTIYVNRFRLNRGKINKVLRKLEKIKSKDATK